MNDPHPLQGSPSPLTDLYDLAMLDLDGVVYVGPDVVPGAAEAITAWRRAGRSIGFVTNNASRTPQSVAAHLVELGVEAAVDDVVTSAQAVAGVLHDRFGAGAVVAALGGAGLVEALAAEGLEVVGVADEAVAVVTGYGPSVLWSDIMRAAVRIRDGLPWFASNTDMTIPTAFGTAPGHGVLVETLSRFAGVDPTVAGKPEPPLLEQTMRRLGASRALMVGDRLDTDIEGGSRVGVDTLLVLTGVTGLPELAAARPAERPTYIAGDLAGLMLAHPAVHASAGRRECGGWSAAVTSGRLEVQGTGAVDDWWRAAAAALWEHLDATGTAAVVDDVEAPR